MDSLEPAAWDQLDRLEALGMVEVRHERDPRSHFLDRWTQVRKTELFGAVFSVEI